MAKNKSLSTTRINLNADNFYSVRDDIYYPNSISVSLRIPQVSWILLNHMRLLRDNIRSAFGNSNFETKKFNLATELIDWETSRKLSTPSRFLGDLFWANQDWSSIQSELGGNISAVDIGCGAGAYLEKLTRYGANFFSYHGFDAFEQLNWKDLEKNYSFAKFIKAKSSEIKSIINLSQPNFFFSQSALEHINDDKQIIDSIAEYAKASGKRVIQIHLVPSEHCIWLYGPHGARIYTIPMLIKLIESREKKSVVFEIHELGGEECYQLHKEFISYCGYFGLKGQDFRNDYPNKYWASLKRAITNDLSNPLKIRTNFYALKIFHNFDAK
tara:strand:+ start:1188 stop:2171 length:984 start_codon:yes stop_codon:yes gene_type:complete